MVGARPGGSARSCRRREASERLDKLPASKCGAAMHAVYECRAPSTPYALPRVTSDAASLIAGSVVTTVSGLVWILMTRAGDRDPGDK